MLMSTTKKCLNSKLTKFVGGYKICLEDPLRQTFNQTTFDRQGRSNGIMFFRQCAQWSNLYNMNTKMIHFRMISSIAPQAR